MVPTILPIGYHIVPSKPHFRILCLIQPTATILKPNPFFSWYQQSHQSVAISSPQNFTFVFSLLSNQQPPLKTQILPSDGTNNPTNRLPYCRLKTSLSHSLSYPTSSHHLRTKSLPVQQSYQLVTITSCQIVTCLLSNLTNNNCYRLAYPSLLSYQQHFLPCSLLKSSLTMSSSRILPIAITLNSTSTSTGSPVYAQKFKNNVIGLSLGVALIPYRTQQNLARLFYT